MKLISAIVMGAALAASTAAQSAAVITIAPDPGIAGGYLPLSLFGISPIAGMGDEAIENFNVPTFSFAGEAWSRLGVVSNGYIVVGGGTSADVEFINTDLPNAASPTNLLAPFWTDLNPGAGGAVRIGTLTDGSDTWIVVDWEAVPNSLDARPNSFQVWIGTNTDATPAEDITFAYGAISDGDGGSLTIGAQDKTGTVGTVYYLNGAGTLPTLEEPSLRVTTRGLPVSIPEPATLALFGLGLAGLGAVRRKKLAA
jgi:hypothetical protein